LQVAEGNSDSPLAEIDSDDTSRPPGSRISECGHQLDVGLADGASVVGVESVGDAWGGGDSVMSGVGEATGLTSGPDGDAEVGFSLARVGEELPPGRGDGAITWMSIRKSKLEIVESQLGETDRSTCPYFDSSERASSTDIPLILAFSSSTFTTGTSAACTVIGITIIEF
jgi:hypothetical protein